jgi:hypothetical protein
MEKVIFAFLIVLLANNLEAKKYNVFQEGEILEYDVSFWGVSLGTIVVETIGEEDFKGRKVYKANSYMKTKSGVPFIKLNDKFTTLMDTSLSFSYKFTSSSEGSGGKWGYQQIDFYYSREEVHFQEWEDKIKTIDTLIQTKRKFNDGTSLFFISRAFIDYGKTIRIPTMINVNTSTTVINFRNKKENVKISAVDYDIETLYFDGQALWEGIYGLKGNFEGWFTDDEAAVPVLAKMNVYIGSVVIELKSWERKGWNPPQAKSKK